MTETLFALAGEEPPAVISDDGVYRYVLNRRWDRSLPVMTLVALNPSVAGWYADDPSVRKMRGFARLAGCGGIRVLNEFALISTDPAGLLTHPDPAGPDNDRWLAGVAGSAGPVVVAWGNNGSLRGRDSQVRKILAGVPLMCFGLTGSGQPRHPGRIAYATPLVPYLEGS